MNDAGTAETQSAAGVQGVIEPHTLSVPILLSQLIDQLVEAEQRRTGASAEVARREVEARVIREGVAVVQREVECG